MQSFGDEFELPQRSYGTPAAPGTTLVKGDVKVNEELHHQYRKGVGKLIHISKYTKAEILNAVRELTRFGSEPSHAHREAMLRVMKYCVDTKEKGLLLKPNAKWDGSKDFEFEITGKSDSDYAKDLETRRSVSGWSVFLNDAPYVRKSKMQKFVTLSVTEAECVAGTSCVQDMMYGKRFLELIGLKVKLPMTLYMDNKGGVDIFNNWSIAGNTRAVSIRFAYIRELKEAGILQIKWIKSQDNCADIFTKNLDGPTFKAHSQVFSG
ncbi:MAG: Ty1/Copia family ribonuclease HI [Bacteroidota bacterium]